MLFQSALAMKAVVDRIGKSRQFPAAEGTISWTAVRELTRTRVTPVGHVWVSRSPQGGAVTHVGHAG